MATETIFAVFADFNERLMDLAPPLIEAVPIPEGDGHQEAWTDGYLAGRQGRGAPGDDPNLNARLITSVSELDEKAAEAIEAASLAVADLLVKTVIAVTADGWSAGLMDRVRLVAGRIEPALTVAPEFILRDDHGSLRRFDSISSLSRVLEDGGAYADVSIRWHRGEATISRSALLADLRQAIVPLSAGLVNAQNAEDHT